MSNFEELRAKAAELGLDEAAIDGFASMDRDTLIMQAALWHQIAVAHQQQSLDAAIQSGELIQTLFNLCREHDIDVPEEIVDATLGLNSTASPRS